MAIQGKITSLYSDRENTEALFPRTKVNAISDDNNIGLDTILRSATYSDPLDNGEAATTPLDADSLAGIPAKDYATQAYVKNEIANAQLNGGGDSGNVDLSGFATKDDITNLNNTISNIDFPVDSVNGKTGAVTLSASDVGASPIGHNHNNEVIYPQGIELGSGVTTGHGGYIDFHYNSSGSDYTSRIVEHNGTIQIEGNLQINNGNLIGVSADKVGAVPTSRTVNGKALSSNISLSASDVGARPSNWTPSAADVGAAPSSHNHDGRYIQCYSLNEINIDNTNGNWTVDVVRGQTGGNVPADWVNVTQTTSGHFFTQIARQVVDSYDGNRASGRIWYREKYANGRVWSAWTPLVSTANLSYSNGTLYISV